VDGVPRVLDVGIAQAKRELPYVAPEQLQRTSQVSRRSDVYAAGVLLWETLTGVRLFIGQNDSEIVERVVSAQIVAPSARVSGLSPAFDAIALRALASDPAARFATAREMALAIEKAWTPASPSTVGAWVAELAQEELAMRAAIVATTDREIVTPKPARSRHWLAALALVAIASVAAAASMGRRGSEARTEVAIAPSSAIPNVLVTEPLTSVSHMPSASKTASLPARAPSPRPARAVRAHCDPPYTIDDAGSRRFKPECF
jgi:eukaryotic-like serine/threonine-protein kinase